jgi:FAD/FMN-containing dehydrogenase
MPALERFLEWSAARSGRADDHPGVCKESSGYALRSFETTGELVDLLVGSEGTLTLFVGIELDLAPTAGAASSILGAFASLDAAVAAAIQVRHAGATACELLDRTFLDVAAAGGGAHVGIDAGTEAVLLAEVEGDDAAGAAAAAAEVKRIFETTGATTVRVALDVVAATELWELRHAASPILSRLDPALKSMQFIEDAAVPPDRLADYVRGVRAALERHDTRGVIFGHAGDAHVHVNPLVDVRRPDWRARVERILHEVTGLVASLAGTVSGEHGDGRLRAPLLPQVWSAAALADFAAVKRAFDPRGVLNPGVKVALPRQASLETIKYDPDAPPLPSGSRAVLDVVERERGYARFRLDVLDSVS